MHWQVVARQSAQYSLQRQHHLRISSIVHSLHTNRSLQPLRQPAYKQHLWEPYRSKGPYQPLRLLCSKGAESSTKDSTDTKFQEKTQDVRPLPCHVCFVHPVWMCNAKEGSRADFEP